VSEGGADSGRTQHGASAATGASPRAEAVADARPVEAGVLQRLAPDAELSVVLPPRTFRGSDQVRGVLRHLGPVVAEEKIVVRENSARQITSVTVPVSEETLADFRATAGLLLGDGGAAASGGGAAGTDDKPRIPWLLPLIGSALIAAISAVATLAGILLDFFPALQDEPPPAVISAALSNVALEERLTDPATGEGSLVISYTVEYSGFKGRRSTIEWAAFDAATQQRVDFDPSGEGAAGANSGVVRIVPEATDERVSERFGFPVPRRALCVIVRVFAYDGDHNRLAYADSAPFHTHNASDPTCQTLAAPPVPAAST